MTNPAAPASSQQENPSKRSWFIPPEKLVVSEPVPLQAKEIVRQFQMAMALMSIIPLLGFVYLVARLAGLEVFVNTRGILTLFIIAVSVGGMMLARTLVSNVVRRLEQVNAELKKASDVKSAFLRNVAHEAGTPLATTRGNLEALKEGFYGPLSENMKKPIVVSVRQVERLLRMVAELLDIAKIDRGELPVNFSRIDLSGVFEEAAEAVGEGLNGTPFRVTLAASKIPRWVRGDKDLLIQVLVNLFRNAEKYSPDGAQVRLEVQEINGAYEVRVIDRGDGVPDEVKQKIFEPFTRNTKRKVGGVGLGLAITRHIVTLHGGRIWVSDNPEGGSIFSFSIPKQPA